MSFASIEEALEDIRAGKMVIVVDDEDRENEGDLVIAAEKVTPEAINFMTKYGRGLVCMPIAPERIDELKIPPMVTENTSTFNTAFTVSVGVKGKMTTGISAYDRANVIRALIDPETTAEDIVMPGHVFPLRARPGGVLERAGHTEAAVDLARLAGLYPAGVICEIMADDGTMARLPELEKFAEKWGLKIITIADLIKYRLKREILVERVVEVNLPTKYGHFQAIAYQYKIDKSIQLALVKGDVRGKENILVRVHSECLTGDVFHSLRCDCGSQLEASLKMINEEGTGVLVYMMGHEGRGIGLINKLKAYKIQEEKGLDTVEANKELGFPPDLRDYGVGAQILVDLGITSMRLITNNPRKIVGLEGYGLKIVERVPIVTCTNPYNEEYLKAKKEKLNHLID
ncbi:MAG: bifunctional 3,4-dihydroxy-2-butanone-4-phosphate synthase/GTP cyclohydrolase II [Actinobacteria bacterium]|nr:bifunctional 3,4-dihydroxy-2-butanone-4-phosphate synthase/GTP cyclohydrolase II [Actinomycetota bacterium]